MERFEKTLVIVSGLKGNNLYEGHVIYLYKFLIKVHPIFKKVIVLVSQTNGLIFRDLPKLQVKDELVDNPLTGYVNLANFLNIKKYQNYESIIHFWYAPKILFLPYFFKRDTMLYSFPDSWSSYYLSKFQLTKKIQFYLKSMFYKSLESAMTKHCYKTIYVSDAEARKNKGFVLPPFLNEYIPNDKKNGILIGRMNTRLLDNVLSAIIRLGVKYPITVINADSSVYLRYQKFNNIHFEGFVDDYESFSSTFLIHLIYDEWSSGMSTKLMNAINTNSLAVGNLPVFRGFPNEIVKEIENEIFIAKNLDTLISNVKTLIQFDYENIMNLINIQKESFRSYIEESNSVKILMKLYDI